MISRLFRFLREYGKSPLDIEIDRVSRALKRHEDELFEMQYSYSIENCICYEDYLDWAIYQKQKKIGRVIARLNQLRQKRQKQ